MLIFPNSIPVSQRKINFMLLLSLRLLTWERERKCWQLSLREKSTNNTQADQFLETLQTDESKRNWIIDEYSWLMNRKFSFEGRKLQSFSSLLISIQIGRAERAKGWIIAEEFHEHPFAWRATWIGSDCYLTFTSRSESILALLTWVNKVIIRIYLFNEKALLRDRIFPFEPFTFTSRATRSLTHF